MPCLSRNENNPSTKELHKRKYPQPFYFICDECYMTLKSKTNLIFDKFLCQICHQDVHVLNFEEINKCLTYKGNKTRNKQLCCLFRKSQNVLLGNGH